MEAAAAALNITHGVKQESKRSRSSNGDEEEAGDHKDDISTFKRGSTKKDHEDGSSSSKPSHSSSSRKDLHNLKQDEELESAKAEMGEVMEENQRLRSYLEGIMKDYHALQMKFYEFARQDQPKPSINIPSIINTNTAPQQADDRDEAELVSLSLGRSLSINSKNKSTFSISDKGKETSPITTTMDETKEGSDSLALGLDSKYEASKGVMAAADTGAAISSTENSLEEPKDEAAGETWPPSKMLKNVRSGDDDVIQQPPVKKARVSVRARCDTPTMNDGCQWRKYGQKIAKGNPCPRAYYRCTVAPSCPVRKQVQRCADDMSILITTYEGAHNHPLPISATAMASTTSAAAYMLMSGLSTSPGLGSNLSNNTTTTAPISTTSSIGLHGMNFNLPDASRSKPFFLPTTSSISPSPSHPTITLDLTSSTSSSSASHLIGRPGTSSTFAPRYSPTNLTFNSSELTSSLPMTWPNGSLLSYNSHPYNNKNQLPYQSLLQTQDCSSMSNIGRHTQDSSIYQSLLQKSGTMSNPSQTSLPDTIVAAAKALTSDPSFHSVLTAALSSFMSGSGGSSGNGGGGGGMSGSIIGGGDGNSTTFAQKMKWGDQAGSGAPSAAAAASSALAKGNNGCGSSFLSIAPSTNSQTPGNLMFRSSPLAFATNSKSNSASPGENRDQTN
ncbi:WRKY transcription factor 72A-like protein [Drosera capensis]